MPAPLLDIRVSRADLDRLHAGIEQYLTQQAPAAPPSSVGRVDDLIRQAGIVTGPAPRQPGRIARAIRRHRAVARQVTVADHLDLAAHIIQTRGWAQRTLQDARGAVCILGAQTLLVHLGHPREVTERAGDWLNRQLGGGATYWQWQDCRWRTRDQVLNLLRTAAANARMEGI
ncbi:hypothetical protein [Streptomyces sp. NBRC 109706]|uniref:DUF6197 family protein n=1 Tax=Streptomyces sp. NBRC 109706 TaxID=1550035 RepID=UPI000781E6E2|nr:hypothetical protein [Streptomyces sp. NBRC 109706]